MITQIFEKENKTKNMKAITMFVLICETKINIKRREHFTSQLVIDARTINTFNF